MKTVLITGGSRGIGKAIAKKFSENNYNVAIVSKSSENLEKTKKEFLTESLNVEIYPCDVTNIEQVRKVVSSVYNKFSSIDILINSAGISFINLLEDDDYSKWHKQIDTNLTGTFYFSKEVFSKMKNNNFGRIINISSVYGLIGGSGYSAYCASKHGVIGLTKSLALEMAPYKITVNAICPAWVETDMFEHDINEMSKIYNIEQDVLINDEKMAVPLQSFISVDEISNLAIYLSSDGAKNITGQAINISGGLAI